MRSSSLFGAKENFVLTIVASTQLINLSFQVGAKRLDAAAKKGNTYSWNLIFGSKKSA
jgi:dehydrogenase/reductase SDR family protein 7